MASTKNAPKSVNPDVASSDQELEDIAKAIELSLKDVSAPHSKRASSSNHNSGHRDSSGHYYNHQDYPRKSSRDLQPLYPSFDHDGSTAGPTNSNNRIPVPSQSPKESYQVRALYDFEAAEDNELTFKTGEMIVVLDDSDTNWWKGSNHRGEGLFPSNFVTKDLSQPEPVKKSVQFNEEVKVKVLENMQAEPVVIDEHKIDHLLFLLHEADPTSETADSEELLTLEEQCSAMNPLIDQELEIVDRRITQLNVVSQQLSEAMESYRGLMQSPYDPQMQPAGQPMYQQPHPTFPGQQPQQFYGHPQQQPDYQHLPPHSMNGDPNSR